MPALSTEPAAESPGRPRWVKVRTTGPTGWPLSPAPLPGASPLLVPRGPRPQLDVGVTHPEVALWQGGADGREAQQRTADGTVDQGPELQRQRAHGVSIAVPGVLTSGSTGWSARPSGAANPAGSCVPFRPPARPLQAGPARGRFLPGSPQALTGDLRPPGTFCSLNESLGQQRDFQPGLC